MKKSWCTVLLAGGLVLAAGCGKKGGGPTAPTPKPTYYVTVTSAPAGAEVTSTPPDLAGTGRARTPVTLAFQEGTQVSIAAPGTLSSGARFGFWRVGGSADLGSSRTLHREVVGDLQCEAVYADVLTVSPAAIGGYCPTWIRGDREFGPNHCNEDFWCTLEIRGSREVWAHIRMKWEEPGWDYSTAVAEFEVMLAAAPTGYSFASILSPTRSEAHRHDTTVGDIDYPPVSPSNGPVAAVAVRGDTSGNDIGRCTSDDAELIEVRFNAILVLMTPDR